MEIAKLVVDPIVSKVFELLVNPVVRQIKYVFNYSANIHNLEEEVKNLRHAKLRVEHTVEVARRNPLEQIEDDVQPWLAKVDSVSEDADKILLQHKDGGKRRCFMGLCPNLIRLHQISRKASKEIPIIVGAREGGSFPRVSYRAPPQGIGAVKECEAFESRTSVVDEILNALKDADVNLIGVYGMGGVGKTTLVKHIATLVRELGIFKLVVKANVTLKADLKSVQQEIAEWLDFKLGAESIAVRAARLTIKLDEIGIPYGNDHNGSKILMTSRNQSVLSEMGVQRDFRLEVLEHKEAWNLFEKKVGDLKDSNLQSIAMEIAEKCAGLPILIVTAATALKNKQLFEWKDTLESLKKFDGKGYEEIIYSALELSYNYLRNDEKSLFLLLGQLRPIVLIQDLLKYVVGLGLYNELVTVEATRNRLLKVISDLKLSCLLLEDGDHKRVKLHDVVHNFAASFASKHHQVLTAANKIELKKWPNEDFFEQCTSISLPYCKIPKLPEVFECPKPKSFLLFNQDPSLKISGNLFSKMKELKVLDLTKINLSPLPSSLQSLENLQTLCLDFCDLEDIAAIGELKQLQVLSLRESTIIRLPNEVRKLTCLRLLDLSGCQRLKVIPPNVLSTLAQLEELYLGGSLVQWEGEGHDEGSNNANLSELKLLSKLSTLEIHIIDANIMPKDIFSEKLESFRVFIGDGWDWANNEYETSRSLKLKLNRSALLERVKVLLMNTESLYLDDLKGVRSVLYELDDQGFPELKHLHVQNSLDIQYIIDWMKMNHFSAFPKLESLFLHNLNNLEKIYRGRHTVGPFSDLRKLKVENCNALRSLFSFSMFNVLKKLEEVNVNNCEIIQVIVAKEGEDDEECELTQLRSLTLENLPQFTSFCSQVKVHSTSQRARNQEIATTASNEIVCEADVEVLVELFNDKIRFPNLADMKLVGINVEMIWRPCQHKALSPSIEKLTTLIVDGCGNLNFLFTSSIVGSLAHLKVLEICDCKSMEEVILAAGEGETMSKILLPKLDSLKLKGLPKLVRFCIAKLIECPSLKVLKMENCPRLQAFVSTQVNTALFDEKVRFPNLEELHVEDMHMLKMIWCDEVLADSFGRLKVLKVLNGKQLLEIFPSNLLEKFLVNLESLTVRHCDSVKEVFDLQAIVKEREAHVVTHSQLRTLEIKNLPNLIQIWNRDPHGILSFYNLREVEACDCPNLKKLFPFSVAQDLPHLELLSIIRCGMEEIVTKEERVEALAIIPKFAFRGLKYMTLWRLHELKYFYSGKHTLECPQLKMLKVHLCAKLQTFNFESQEIHMDKQEDELKLQIPQPLFSFREVGFSGLQHLKLSEFSQLKEAWKTQLPVNFFYNLSSLERFAYNELEIINSALFDEKVAFPNLEKMQILSMDYLNMLWHKQLHSDSFCKIKGLTVEHCEELLQIFPSMLLRRLQNLEDLIVDNCDSLEEVFDLQEIIKLKETVTIQLRTLDIRNLPNLKHVWNKDPMGLVLFDNLSSVVVWVCPNLKAIFPAAIAKNLLQLETLNVKGCGGVEEIVAQDQGTEATIEFLFPCLEFLKLQELNELKCFYSGIHTLESPLLKYLTVYHCEKLNIFCPESENLLETDTESQAMIQDPQQLFSFRKV
uniref:NB-ARC domain-containing protein n=1 Tax=Manihot esculenta TaxID=3983 RepID=A0A2C9WFZ5_MANES